MLSAEFPPILGSLAPASPDGNRESSTMEQVCAGSSSHGKPLMIPRFWLHRSTKLKLNTYDLGNGSATPCNHADIKSICYPSPNYSPLVLVLRLPRVLIRWSGDIPFQPSAAAQLESLEASFVDLGHFGREGTAAKCRAMFAYSIKCSFA